MLYEKLARVSADRQFAGRIGFAPIRAANAMPRFSKKDKDG